MGGAIAARLAAAGWSVTGWDIDAGARARSSVPLSPDLADVDVLVTVLPGAAEVEPALVGLEPALRPGTVWLDLTSNDPRIADRVADLLSARDVASVAAPMQGGPADAAAGTIAFTVSGDAAAIERMRPLLAELGDAEAAVVGERVGQAHTLKLAANALWFAQALAFAEALRLAASAGISGERALEVLRRGATSSALLDAWAPRLLAGDTAPEFALERVVEELDAVVELARASGLPGPVTATTAAVHREALARFGAGPGELLGAVHLLSD